MINYFSLFKRNVSKYKFLISQLVSRDFKSKYKRSILGVLWSLLNPLLTMIVQFLVFSTLFNADTRNYPIYLISGVVCFNFFGDATNQCLISLTSNANLLNKVYIPKYIFPFTKLISAAINFVISLIPLVIVSVCTGVEFSFTWFLGLYFLICLLVFSLGIGLMLSASMVYFRDLQFLWSVAIQILSFATPIFYPAEIIPEKYRFVVRLNPLYHFIGNLRKCLIDCVVPEAEAFIVCLLFSLGALILGCFVFKKLQDNFSLYL